MKHPKLLSLLILALMAHGFTTQCTDGCLMCQKIDVNSSRCRICDSFASYVPFGDGLCFKLKVEGCLIPTSDRSVTKCLKCKDGTIYDTTTHKCKEVASPIENCQRYDNSAACSLCANDHYLKEAKCAKVATPVENCGVYSTDGVTCDSCLNGFYKSPFDGKCTSIETAENCLAYSRWDCLQCNSGYVINSNYEFRDTLKKSQLQTFVSSFISKTADLGLVLANTPVDNCQKGVVLNCQIHETFDTCKNCNSGFLLSENKKLCQRLPEQPISNCKIYSTATTCLTCVNGTYKDVNGNCVASTVVANCFMYSQSADVCDTCEYGFYKDAPACKARVNSLNVKQCNTYHPTKDECQECNPNFVLLAPANANCLTGVINCKTYNITGTTVKCTECDAGYGLNAQLQCLGLSTQYCNLYDGFSNVCKECNADYYVDSVTKKCFPNTAMNCGTKHKDLNQCVTCNTDFWADSGICMIQNIPNCVEYESNVDECKTCISGNYLDSTSKKCFKNTSKFCGTPSTNSNECTTCNTDYYPDSGHADKCVKQNKVGCKTYTTNSPLCSSCKTDHFPEPTADVKCTPQDGSIPFCDTYQPGLKICTDCRLGTYIASAGALCTTYADGECVTQVKDLDQCSKCNNKFYINSGDCTAINVTGCSTSDGTASARACTNCDADRFRADATTCTSRSSPVPKDQICTANANALDDGSCSVCPQGQTSFYTDVHDGSIDVFSCQKFNSSTGACEQCKLDGFSLSASAICVSTMSSFSEAHTCRSKTTAGIAEQLNVPGKCAKCTFSYHFLDSADNGGTCKARDPADTLNCSVQNPVAKTCAECAKGSVHAAIDKTITCLKKEPHANFASGINGIQCNAWNEDLTKCYACKGSKSGDTCGTTITETIILNIIQNDFSVVPVSSIPTANFTGCVAGNFGTISNGAGDTVTPSCLGCADTHMKIVSAYAGGALTIYPASSTLKNTDTNKTIKNPFPEQTATALPCHAKASDASSYAGFARKDSTGAVNFTITFDNIAEMLQTEHGYVTSRCKPGFNPTWADIEYSDTGSTLLTPSTNGFYGLMITACTAADSQVAAPIKRYAGLEAGFNAFEGLHLSALLHYDSCILSTDLFVFVGKQDATSKHLYFSKIGAGDAHEVCIKPTIGDGTSHTIIANCQIHFHEGTDNDFSGAQSLKCLACKPGFSPAYTGATDKTITACAAITNCDTSIESENTWMNSCQKCKTGFAWEIVKATLLPNYGVCEGIGKTNCLFKDSTADKCIFCVPGYINDGNDGCQKWEISNCKTVGVPDIPTILAANSDSHVNQLAYTLFSPAVNYFYIGGGNYAKLYAKSGCVQCDSGYVRVTSDSTSDKYCTGTTAGLWYSTAVVTDCLRYSATTSVCVECKAGMVFNGTACEGETTPTTNCLVHAANSCTSCRSGHPPQNNACPMYENCADVDSTSYMCSRCEAYYKPKTGAMDYDCEPRGSNDVCKYYDHFNICLACDDPLKSPITFVSGQNVGYRTVCVAKYQDKLTSGTKSDYAKFTSYTIRTSAPTPPPPLPRVFSKVLPSASTFTMKSYRVFDESKGYPTETEYRNSFYGSVCLESPTTLHCKTYDANLECSECKPGFILDTNNKLCLEGTVDNCQEYDSNPHCTKCQVDFYMSGTGAAAKCESRFNKNCKDYKDDADQCQSCLETAFYTASNGTCTNYTVTNCGVFNLTANECTSCELGVTYLDVSDGNKCKPYTKQFCKGWELQKDECNDCHPNRYLATSKECEEYTVTNCKGTNETTADKCTDCQAFFYLTDGKCLSATAENCFALNSTVDKCAGCKKGYYDNGADKCVANTAENCAVKSQTENKCTSCLAVHYKDGNNDCQAHTAKNCMAYEGSSNECSSCSKGFYLNTSGAVKQCDPNGSAFCSTKSTTANECEICLDKYYLNASNQCQSITNTTCAKMVRNKNDCDTCSKGKYVDQTDKMCKQLTEVNFCLVYSKISDKCLTCEIGYYKSADEKSCFVNPNGILSCVRYTNLATCEACASTHYLNENVCVKYDAATEVVVNCVEYTGVKICSKCGPTFIAVDNVCVALVATGCATWADKDTCETCPAGQILGDGSPKNCEAITITGCIAATGAKGSETCVRCNSTTYLKDNKCETLTITVADCVEYSSDGICAKCPATKALAADGKSCIAIDIATLGSQCALGAYGATPKCSLCDSGFLMDAEGKCTISCQTTNCFLCDSVNTAKCSLCMSGFHMDSELKCVANQGETIASALIWNSRLMMITLFWIFVVSLSWTGLE